MPAPWFSLKFGSRDVNSRQSAYIEGYLSLFHGVCGGQTSLSCFLSLQPNIARHLRARWLPWNVSLRCALTNALNASLSVFVWRSPAWRSSAWDSLIWGSLVESSGTPSSLLLTFSTDFRDYQCVRSTFLDIVGRRIPSWSHGVQTEVSQVLWVSDALLFRHYWAFAQEPAWFRGSDERFTCSLLEEWTPGVRPALSRHVMHVIAEIR